MSNSTLPEYTRDANESRMWQMQWQRLQSKLHLFREPATRSDRTGVYFLEFPDNISLLILPRSEFDKYKGRPSWNQRMEQTYSTTYTNRSEIKLPDSYGFLTAPKENGQTSVIGFKATIEQKDVLVAFAADGTLTIDIAREPKKAQAYRELLKTLADSGQVFQTQQLLMRGVQPYEFICILPDPRTGQPIKELQILSPFEPNEIVLSTTQDQTEPVPTQVAAEKKRIRPSRPVYESILLKEAGITLNSDEKICLQNARAAYEKYLNDPQNFAAAFADVMTAVTSFENPAQLLTASTANQNRLFTGNDMLHGFYALCTDLLAQNLTDTQNSLYREGIEYIKKFCIKDPETGKKIDLVAEFPVLIETFHQLMARKYGIFKLAHIPHFKVLSNAYIQHIRSTTSE